MTSVEQLIGNLLLRHNCVIIPSFGGFVAQRVSARIDYSNGSMLPPGKSILFNRQLLNNDGLLVNEFARENEVSYDDASKELQTLVDQWQATLKEGGRIEIERVGNLFYDDERNICFEQDRFANLLLESFGLGSVHFVTEEDVRIVEQKIVVEEPKEEKVVPVVETKSIKLEKQPEDAPTVQKQEAKEETPIIPIAAPVEEKKVVAETPKVADPKPRNRAWRYVAAACILPIAFYSVWIPVKTDVLESGMISFSDFNPLHKRSEGTYKPVKKSVDWKADQTERATLSEEVENVENKVYTYQLDDETYIKVSLPEKETPVVETNDSNGETLTPNPSPTFEPNAMHYIVGCFGDKVNADNLVAKMRANGLEASIVDVQGGLHRVTAGGAISEEAYQTIKLKADAMGLTGWRLR